MFISLTTWHIEPARRKPVDVNFANIVAVEAHPETGGCTLYPVHGPLILTVEDIAYCRHGGAALPEAPAPEAPASEAPASRKSRSEPAGAA